jgi:hypothetical protein
MSYTSPPLGENKQQRHRGGRRDVVCNRGRTGRVCMKPATHIPVPAYQLIGVCRSNWYLSKNLGYFCLTCYALFLIIACMIEANVFYFVNMPNCLK